MNIPPKIYEEIEFDTLHPKLSKDENDHCQLLKFGVTDNKKPSKLLTSTIRNTYRHSDNSRFSKNITDEEIIYVKIITDIFEHGYIPDVIDTNKLMNSIREYPTCRKKFQNDVINTMNSNGRNVNIDFFDNVNTLEISLFIFVNKLGKEISKLKFPTDITVEDFITDEGDLDDIIGVDLIEAIYEIIFAERGFVIGNHGISKSDAKRMPTLLLDDKLDYNIYTLLCHMKYADYKYASVIYCITNSVNEFILEKLKSFKIFKVKTHELMERLKYISKFIPIHEYVYDSFNFISSIFDRKHPVLILNTYVKICEHLFGMRTNGNSTMNDFEYNVFNPKYTKEENAYYQILKYKNIPDNYTYDVDRDIRNLMKEVNFKSSQLRIRIVSLYHDYLSYCFKYFKLPPEELYSTSDFLDYGIIDVELKHKVFKTLYSLLEVRFGSDCKNIIKETVWMNTCCIIKLIGNQNLRIIYKIIKLIMLVGDDVMNNETISNIKIGFKDISLSGKSCQFFDVAFNIHDLYLFTTSSKLSKRATDDIQDIVYKQYLLRIIIHESNSIKSIENTIVIIPLVIYLKYGKLPSIDYKQVNNYIVNIEDVSTVDFHDNHIDLDEYDLEFINNLSSGSYSEEVEFQDLKIIFDQQVERKRGCGLYRL